MNAAPPSSTERLDRLDRYLHEDAGNPALLADAFDTALGCGRHDAAAGYLDAARASGLTGAEWDFRCARLCIATRDLDGAAHLLEQLLVHAAGSTVLVHDLGYVRLLQGRCAEVRSLLGPWFESETRTDSAVLAPMQVLWLRCLHGDEALDEAWTWVDNAQASGKLQPAAMGVASLIAIDRSDFASARRLADASLEAGDAPPEALVARASVALAMRESSLAVRLLEQALAINPQDGRVHSAMGMAFLQIRDLAMSRRHLELAVRRVPRHVGTWHALGWVQLLQADRGGALRAFGQALVLDRNFAESHGAVGLLLALEGHTEQALHHLDLADRLDGQNVTGRYARAWLAGEAGDTARLQALALRLLDRPGFFGGKLSDAAAQGSVQAT